MNIDAIKNAIEMLEKWKRTNESFGINAPHEAIANIETIQTALWALKNELDEANKKYINIETFAEIKNMIKEVGKSVEIDHLRNSITLILNRELERTKGCSWCRKCKKSYMWECTPVEDWEKYSELLELGELTFLEADFCPVCGKQLRTDDDCED